MRGEVDAMGEDAGRVWEYLNKNGDASTTQLAKGLKTTTPKIHRALGWLAREGKIQIERVKGIEQISLTGE